MISERAVPNSCTHSSNFALSCTATERDNHTQRNTIVALPSSEDCTHAIADNLAPSTPAEYNDRTDSDILAAEHYKRNTDVPVCTSLFPHVGEELRLIPSWRMKPTE